MDELTKQISAKTNCLVSPETITEYSNFNREKVIKTVNVPWYVKVPGFSPVFRNLCKNSKMI